MRKSLKWSASVGLKPCEHPGWSVKLAPICKGDRETEEAGHSRWVGDKFNKQANLYGRLVLGGCKMSRSPHPP